MAIDLDPILTEEFGIRVDLHEGTYLQRGVTSIFRDTAVRRGFIDGKNVFDWIGEADGSNKNVHSSHAQLALAIEAALLHSLHGTGVTGELTHPSAPNSLPLSSIKVWKWGPNAYFELRYRRTRETNVPEPAAHTATWRTAYDHAIAYRTAFTGGGFAVYLDGLPNGDLDFPNVDAGETDEANRPVGSVHKRTTQKFTIRTVLNQNPHGMTGSGSLVNAGHINQADLVGFGDYELVIGMLPNTVRFDGAIVSWLSTDRFAVQYDFTFIATGHFHQEPFWDGTKWSVRNVISHTSTIWDQVDTFPVRF